MGWEGAWVGMGGTDGQDDKTKPCQGWCSLASCSIRPSLLGAIPGLQQHTLLFLLEDVSWDR